MRGENEALVVIDLQNDFCPGGALAVQGGDEIIAGINALMAEFSCVVLSQDWHPAGHSSFASSHPGAAPFSQSEAGYGLQTLWPDHCIAGSRGAEFHPGLDLQPAQLILRKGFRRPIDSYSAFYENDRVTGTGLEAWLRARGIERLTLAGLATDFCVAWSALDAVRLGFAAEVRLDLSRAIDQQGSLDAACAAMTKAGVRLIPQP